MDSELLLFLRVRIISHSRFLIPMETQCQFHAKEIAHSLDLSNYDGIVCVSGDGNLAKVMNGLLEMEDWDSAIKMPIGIIPADVPHRRRYRKWDGRVDFGCCWSSMFTILCHPCHYPRHGQSAEHKQSLDVATILMLAWGHGGGGYRYRIREV